jgi:hypothetical protein
MYRDILCMLVTLTSLVGTSTEILGSEGVVIDVMGCRITLPTGYVLTRPIDSNAIIFTQAGHDRLPSLVSVKYNSALSNIEATKEGYQASVVDDIELSYIHRLVKTRISRNSPAFVHWVAQLTDGTDVVTFSGRDVSYWEEVWGSCSDQLGLKWERKRSDMQDP